MDLDLVSSPDADGLEAGAGAAPSAERLAQALRSVGVHARLVAVAPDGARPLRRPPPPEPCTGQELQPRATSIRLGPEHLDRALRRLWSVSPPAVVHAHGRTAAVASLAAAPQGVPVVVTLGPPAPGGPTPEDVRSDADLADAAALVAASSRAACRRLLEAGIPSRRIAYLPPAVDLARRRGAAWRRAVGRAGELLVGHVALPGTDGGTDDLLAAMAAWPGCRAIVTDPTGRAAGRLKRAVRQTGLADRVEVCSAVGADQGLDAVLERCDVLVCTPTIEVPGSVALEALAAGVPVVAARLGGLADLVVHEATGLLIAPDSSDALAAALRTLRDDPVRRHLYGLAARTRARRHALDRVGLHASLVYANLAPPRGSRPRAAAVAPRTSATPTPGGALGVEAHRTIA